MIAPILACPIAGYYWLRFSQMRGFLPTLIYVFYKYSQDEDNVCITFEPVLAFLSANTACFLGSAHD